MTRKNKSARRAVAAAAATAAAAARAAPDESGAQDSPAQQPTSPLRLPTLVPEAAPPPPPHPGSPASNAAGREQLAGSISDYIQAVNALTPAEAALQDMPAFQFAAVKLAQSHLNTDTQLSAEHVGAALDELDASAWAKSLKPGTDDGALDIAYEELLRACVPSGKDSAAGALAWVIGIMRQNPIILECEVRAMVARGEDFKAFPKLCELAFLTFLQWGPDHPYTVREVYRVTESLFQRAEIRSALVTWLLPRAVEHWGIGHPDTLRLVQHSAIHLYKCKDPRDLAEFARVVTEIAQQLPGGLGWGSAIVAPVPDEERFNSYVFMSFKAIEAKGQGHYRLAQDMLNRCVAYFDTLGAHWLGTPRKLQCMRTLADCVDDLEGFSASEPLLMQAKRTAQRELGATHEATLDIMWTHGVTLIAAKRLQQALSVYQKTLRLRKETMGPRHFQVLESQTTVAGFLLSLGKLPQGEAMVRETFETALKVEGPRGRSVSGALATYWMILEDTGRKRQARALRDRAKKLGCKLDLVQMLDTFDSPEDARNLYDQLVSSGVM